MTAHLLARASVLLLLVTGTADAGPLPDWSYRNPTVQLTASPGSTGGITLSNTAFELHSGDADILATSFASYSVATAGSPDSVSSLPYQFTLELRDESSGQTSQLFFSGVVSGSVWRQGSTLENSFTSPASSSVSMGGYEYTVTLTDFIAPTGYGEGGAGGIYARVTVEEPMQSQEPINNTPEPTTAALAVLGLAIGGFFAARRRKRAG